MYAMLCFFRANCGWVTAVAIFYCCLALCSASKDEHGQTARLIDDLTGPNSRYNRTVMPASICQPSNSTSNSSETPESCPFVVHVRLFLIRIQEVIENEETLITTSRLQVGWYDPALIWNPDEYGGLDAIVIPGSSIWSPDLHVANTVEDHYSLRKDDDIAVRVTNEGRVWFHPTGRLLTRCALNLTYYPYDYQRCSMVIESSIYTYKELEVMIRPDKPDAVSLGMYTQNPMWTLMDAYGFPAIYKTGHNTGFSRIHFWFILKRKADYFERTFLIPLCLLSMLQVLTYLIPMHNIDRVPQATVVMLTAFFLQSYVGDSLPRTSEESLVQGYLNLIIALSVGTVLVCVITSELVDPDNGLVLWGLRSICRIRKSKKVQSSINIDGIDFIDGSYYENQQNPTSQHVLSISNRGSKKVKKSRTAIFAAAFINWMGFFICVALSIAYPLLAFVKTSINDAPEKPKPNENGLTLSYYAEL